MRWEWLVKNRLTIDIYPLLLGEDVHNIEIIGVIKSV